jgi:hypothetical protein
MLDLYVVAADQLPPHFVGSPRAVRRAVGSGCPQRRAGLDIWLRTDEWDRSIALQGCRLFFKMLSVGVVWLEAIANGQAPV